MAKVWQARTVEPGKTNKFFIKTTNGGYNKCILGNEKYRPFKGSVLSNCVGYAYGRFMEVGGNSQGVTSCKLPTCNAEDWYESCTAYTKSQTPKLGAVIVWAGGRRWYSADGCGHVAIVEGINYKNNELYSLNLSESDWSGPVFKKRTVYYKNGKPYLGSKFTFLGFILNPWESTNYKLTEEKYKTTANLNLRAKATTSSNVILVIPRNATIIVTDSENGWASAEYNGKKGYVSTTYIKKV